MSGAIRSTGALISGGIADRGMREGQRDALDGRRDAFYDMKRGTKKARRQLVKGAREVRRIYRPYNQAGQQGLSDYQAKLAEIDSMDPFSFDSSQIENNPAYQFRLQQGLDALDRQYAARGGIGSGNRLTGITDYAQGLASTEYDNEYRRQAQAYNDRFGQEMALAGRYGGISEMGLNVADTLAQTRNNLRSGIANLVMNRARFNAGLSTEAGDIRASTTLARAGNWAATNMYMADQAGGEFDKWFGGSMKSGGGGGTPDYAGMTNQAQDMGGYA